MTDADGTTHTRDYAILNGTYVAATAGVIYLLRRKGRQETLPIKELPLLAAATFTLAEVLSHQKIADWLREPFVVETADHRPSSPRGEGLRRAVGELMTCSRCAGTWSALGLLGLRASSPLAGRTFASLLALSGVNDFLQAHFRWLTEKAKRCRGGEPVAMAASNSKTTSNKPKAYGYFADKEALVKRLKRIEGQVRGIERMVEDERYCIDILTQISAATTALDSLGLKLLEQHVLSCVAGSFASGDEADAAAKSRELIEAVERFTKAR